MSNNEMTTELAFSAHPSIDEIAAEVALILKRRLDAKDTLKLLQVVFLEVEEAAELLRVKPKTISTWISHGKIPVRYAGGRPIFLLSELLEWTLPPDDKHSPHRLSVSASCKIAKNRLAAMRERKS
ncbi:MAG TPA: helix-turn-helix domain-containing protein [Candidatus Saccharimonadales bacterium]|jgi:excisionase family DNA binding protein|nr:helix-turn-helix domain-containing protein [Candidatus Saccharimonadales bacterium]